MVLAVQALVACLGHLMVHAQSYENSYDRNIYLPTVEAGQVDTLNGTRDEQYLGQWLLDLKSNSSTMEERIAFKGFKNDPSESIFTSKNYLDINNLVVNTTSTILRPELIGAHFRSPHTLDLLDDAGSRAVRILWSNNAGFIDSTNQTILLPPIAVPLHTYSIGDPIIAPFDHDSTDDLIVLFEEPFVPDSGYSTVVACYYRGTELYGKDTIRPQSTQFVQVVAAHKPFFLAPITGYFRSGARKDIISTDISNNLFFVNNDKPFALNRLIDALLHDTLVAQHDNPQLDPNHLSHSTLRSLYSLSAIPMQAFPKAKWDHSDDFLFMIPDNSDSAHFNPTHVYMFRGGSQFGSKRLRLDSADYILKTPDDYDVRPSPLNMTKIQDCGDMTGTGNRVLLVSCSIDGDFYGLYFFYVTGRALDSTVDMYYGLGGGGYGEGFPINADGDGFQDVILAMPSFATAYDVSQNKRAVGTLRVLHGSQKIPVKLNGKFGVTGQKRSLESPLVYPSPANTFLMVSIPEPDASTLTVKVFDLLGREMTATGLRVSANGVVRLETSKLNAGSYILEITTQGNIYHSKVDIVH
jgi:hypothetical protein